MDRTKLEHIIHRVKKINYVAGCNTTDALKHVRTRVLIEELAELEIEEGCEVSAEEIDLICFWTGLFNFSRNDLNAVKACICSKEVQEQWKKIVAFTQAKQFDLADEGMDVYYTIKDKIINSFENLTYYRRRTI